MKFRELTIIEDPMFYQYTTEDELEKLNAIELTIALSVLRREQRRLQDKVQIKGTYTNAKADEIDKESYKEVKKYRNTLEQVLFDKQGFIPAQITEVMIKKSITQYEKTVAKFSKKVNK